MSVHSRLRVLTVALAFLPSSALLLSSQLPTAASHRADERAVAEDTTDVRGDALDAIGETSAEKESREGQNADAPDCALTAPWSLPPARCSVALVTEHRPLEHGHSVARHAARGPPRG